MNSRKRILDSAFYLEKHEKSEGAQADAAALRELDQLLSDSVKFIESMGMLAPDGEPAKLWRRFRQAGYGDK